ncbi:MAG TPA: hypothetical protein VK644_12800, partial [Chitinophagaceae bacterium]|nr:hypothetical protein [Chitinophagaceae bacterium]
GFDEALLLQFAEELSLTHPGVIHLARELEKKGFIESVKASDDARKRLLRLSKKGKKALPVFQKLWDKIAKLNKQLMNAQQNHLLRSLEEMEALLEDQSYYKRFQKL